MGSSRKENSGKRRSSTAKQEDGSKATGLGPVADACAHIVSELLKKEDAFSFSEPVTKLWSLDELPDYFDIVKEPMDLGTIMTKIRTVKYVVDHGNGLFFDNEEFARDVRLVFENCKNYNQPKTEFHMLATNFLKTFEDMYRSVDFEGLAKGERKGGEEAGGEKEDMDVDMVNGQDVRGGEGGDEDKGKVVDTKLINTSSVSSDDQNLMENEEDTEFAFVSTTGMEKKRGRKSTVIMSLEEKHKMLMRQRKLIKESMEELERRKQVPITYEEKARMCEDVANLDFVRMRSVVDIIVRGIDRPDILDQEEVELDIDILDRRTFRDVQVFLENPSLMSAHGTLRSVEAEIAALEAQIVKIRYRKAGTGSD